MAWVPGVLLGVGLNIRRTDLSRTRGRFGWGGGFGLSAYTGPAEGLVGSFSSSKLCSALSR